MKIFKKLFVIKRKNDSLYSSYKLITEFGYDKPHFIRGIPVPHGPPLRPASERQLKAYELYRKMLFNKSPRECEELLKEIGKIK